MLSVSGLDHLNLNVVNLQESINFYNLLFGFEVKEQGISASGSSYAIIGASDAAYLCLYENLDRPVEGDRSKKYLNHLGFHVSNYGHVKAALDKLNIPIEQEYGYEKSNSIYVLDPSGIEIEISEKFGGDLH
ncbi:MAG: VOC family protein [Bacteriovoracaceae bacterium]|jgi:lactoylglutathione lyase|nr:VOC family protein [Bacteriovoracaceae bacterium]